MPGGRFPTARCTRSTGEAADFREGWLDEIFDPAAVKRSGQAICSPLIGVRPRLNPTACRGNKRCGETQREEMDETPSRQTLGAWNCRGMRHGGIAAGARRPLSHRAVQLMYGNTWRHQMVDAFQAVAAQAKKDGVISDYIVLNGDGSVNQQMSQMGDLILRHVDGIVITPPRRPR